MLKTPKEKVLWANHAIQRAAEASFKCEDIYISWNRAVEQELSEKMKAYKFSKYGMLSLRDKYFWDEESQILFTVSISRTGQWFIQTVTKGRGNFNL